MQFGHFDDAAREYVITTPQTPLPWINYLGSEEFFSLVSNTAGGYSFFRDAKLRRLTRYRYNNVPGDSNGRYFYIREGDTVWNPGWQPARTPLDSYTCRHGLGYTVILIVMCVVRELLGKGAFGGGILNGGDGIQLFPTHFAALGMALPVGGFLTLACVIAAMQYFLSKPKKKSEEKEEVAK